MGGGLAGSAAVGNGREASRDSATATPAHWDWDWDWDWTGTGDVRDLQTLKTFRRKSAAAGKALWALAAAGANAGEAE